MVDLLEQGDERILQHPDLFKDVIEANIHIQPMNQSEAQQFQLIKLNYTQEEFINEYFRQIEERNAVRIITLKGRRCGVSTCNAAITIIEMFCRPALRACVVAPKLGRQTKSLYNQLYYNMLKKLPFDDPKVAHHKQQDGGFVLYNRESGLRVDFEEELIGVGLDILHITEAAYFSDLGKYLSHASHCLAEGGRNMIVIESTSRAYGNMYHKQWQLAEAGEISYRPLFFSWFSHEFNKLPIKDNDERAHLSEQIEMGNVSKFGNEVQLRDEHSLTLEQLKWRREKIRNARGGISEFYREYPTTPEEAFLQSSANVFDTKAMKHYRTEDITKPELVGEFEVDHARHHELATHLTPSSSPGLVNVFEKPHPNCEYVIGADVSEGRGDFSAAVVIKRRPLEIVAWLRGYDYRNLEPLAFADQLFHLGKFYNMPHMVIENNAAGASVIMQLTNYGYYSMMSMEELFPNAPNVTARSDEIGWRNTKSSRKIMVDRIVKYVNNLMFKIPDLQTVEEMMNFVWVGYEEGKEDKVQAAMKGKPRKPGEPEVGYYDDRIFALMGALAGHEALGTARSQREMALESEFHDHDILAADMGTPIESGYDPFEDPFGYDFTDTELAHTFSNETVF